MTRFNDPGYQSTCGKSSIAAIAALILLPLSLAADELPRSEPSFKGKIGFSAKESVPDWPQTTRASKGAPNIVVILLDDIGFADTSTFGGAAQTPALDELARTGLRYNNFNTTAMCSPTRAALLTGRNHHRTGFGTIADFAGGYPGYNSIWKKSTASIAQVLRLNGYSTAAFGKWHNTPDWEIAPTGPFDRWPTGLGFEYFYGFMGPEGQDNQWEPTKLYRNTTPVDAPTSSEQHYHLTTDLVDEAIGWIETHQSLASQQPYFVYFAPGAVHGPHHAPKEWIDRYRGKFDQGWDGLREESFARQKKLGVIPGDAKLTPRPHEIAAWQSLSAEQRKLFARQMEVYAAFISHTDAQIGRLLHTVRAAPDADNTLILYIVGDNGAAGGLFDFPADLQQQQLRLIDDLGSAKLPSNHYAGGWAWAGSTPFQWWKVVASHFGGVRNPLVVSWPARIKDKGALRTQFTHVNDVAATIYEVANITPPTAVNGVEQLPLDGVSFAQTFNDPAAPSTHRTQYFEMMGNRAIYQDGWVAAARHPASFNWLTSNQHDYATDRWELYHVASDFSEAEDLAEKYPTKLKELQALFDIEARKNDVYPLGAEFSQGKPSLTLGKRQFVYYPGARRIPDALLPDLPQSSYRLSAEVAIPAGGCEGVLASYGDRASGFVWYVKGGQLVYENRASSQHQVVIAQAPLPPGQAILAVAYEPNPAYKNNKKTWGSGTVRLYINGELAAAKDLPLVRQARDAAMFIGYGAGSPVSRAFSQPFEFTGTLERLTLELGDIKLSGDANLTSTPSDRAIVEERRRR